MAIVTTDSKHYSNIAAAIREKTGEATTYKPEEIPTGVEEVFEAGKQSAYETVVMAQDYTAILQVYNTFAAINSPDDKIVLYINKAWNDIPSADTKNNQFLYMLWLSPEFKISTEAAYSPWMRWRDNNYYVNTIVNDAYDCVLSAGDEVIRVVLA